MSSQPLATRRIFNLIIAVTGLLLCLWGIWNAGRTGLSRLLSKYASLTIALNAPLLSPADQAVSLTPADPDAHFSRAAVLWNVGRTSEAVESYERAAALRPRDYYLWMMLGNSRDQAEDEKGALAALNEAVSGAPYYAQPRWQYGNVLFRAGQPAEGFTEMRRAALSDQKFLSNMIDLAWGASNKDAAATEKLIQPENRLWRMALARHFARRGNAAAALDQYRAAGAAAAVAEQEQRALMAELLATKGYAEAYEVWATGKVFNGNRSQQQGPGHITNGSFEEQLSFDESGFGWQFVRNPAVLQFSLDTTEPNSGAHSLRLEWNGYSAPTPAVTSQLVLVEPNTRYRLSFAARTQEMVSGGLPLLVVLDKNGGDDRPLAQSKTLPKGSVGWHEYLLEFATANDTRAILIGLQRESCGGDPCPIFGRLWLDNFALRKLSSATEH